MSPRVLHQIGNLLLTGWLIAAPTFARADVQDYCSAVARDFADLRPKDRDIWQQRFDGAEADCVEQFSISSTVATTEKPPTRPKSKAAAKPAATDKASVKRSIAKREPDSVTASATKKTDAATPDATTKAQPGKPKLVVGSPQWLDYCDRKYASFDRTKGTYRSKTGVERKCLITADFQ